MTAAAFALLPLFTLPALAQITTYAALQTAINGGGAVTLTQDLSGSTQLTIPADITLDLNGFSLTIDLPDLTGRNANGIKIATGVTLTIMDSNSGINELNIRNRSMNSSNGNGAAINTSDGTLVIQSGTVTATGGVGGAGIGGGSTGSGGTITITGGNVTANGGFIGAGIGGGYDGSGGNITITGGEVTANGGNSGAGIGGGNGAGGNITITGGEVTANGGTGSAGIGGGSYGAGGNTVITGGTVTATGGNSGSGNVGGGAGIGGGTVYDNTVPSGASGSITIAGTAVVTATGGTGIISGEGGGGGAGIGSGGSGTGIASPFTPGTAGAAGDTANPIIIEGTAIVNSTGGAGRGGRNGANIGQGGGASASSDITPGTTVTRHNITATAGAGGSITPSGNVQVVDKANQVFTVTANAGYVISTVTGQTVTNSRQFLFVIPAVTSDQNIAAAFAAKAVSVAAQSGALTFGTAGSATFAVTTTNIADGTYPASLGGAPADVAADNVTVSGGAATLTVRTSATTPAGTHSLTLTMDGTTSSSFDLRIDPAPITTAAITVTSPNTGATPDTSAGGTGNFTVGAVTWSPADSPFQGSTAYTASVTLTANTNDTFTGLTTATINGQNATVTNNTGATVTLSHTFAATGAKTVTGITITNQPTNLSYTHGDSLSLAGLVVNIIYNDGTNEDVPFASFEMHNISASPANSAALVHATHNGQPVVVSIGAYSANTNPLTVNATVSSTPQNFTATAGDGQVMLSWAAPASDGGSAITRYEVSSDGGGSWVAASSDTGHTFTSLTNRVLYTFAVRAVNGAGAGLTATATATPVALSSGNLASIPVLHPAGLVLLVLMLAGLAVRRRHQTS